MKSVKQMMPKNLMERIHARWGTAPRVIVNDGSRYGSVNNEDFVHNAIVGTVTVQELKTLEFEGVVKWQDGGWRVPRGSIFVNGKPARPVSYKYLEYMRKHHPSHLPDPEQANSLVNQAAEIFGGNIVRE